MAIDDHLRTVTDGARCFLATQQQQVIASIMELEGDHLGARARGEAGPADPILIGPLADIRDGEAVLDEHQLREAARLELRRRRLRAEPRGAVPRAAPECRPHHVASRPGRRRSAAAPAATPEPAPRRLHEAVAVPEEQLHGDPEERLYASAPIDTDDGPVVVIHEQDAPEEGEPAPGS